MFYLLEAARTFCRLMNKALYTPIFSNTRSVATPNMSSPSEQPIPSDPCIRYIYYNLILPSHIQLYINSFSIEETWLLYFDFTNCFLEILALRFSKESCTNDIIPKTSFIFQIELEKYINSKFRLLKDFLHWYRFG